MKVGKEVGEGEGGGGVGREERWEGGERGMVGEKRGGV